MKVAVSVPDPIFEAAERLAKQRPVPRSQLSAEALEAYLEARDAQAVTASLNGSKISTVLVAVITSNLILADAPGNVRLNKSSGGLSKASVVNVSHLLTMDRGLPGKPVGVLPEL